MNIPFKKVGVVPAQYIVAWNGLKLRLSTKKLTIWGREINAPINVNASDMEAIALKEMFIGLELFLDKTNFKQQYISPNPLNSPNQPNPPHSPNPLEPPSESNSKGDIGESGESKGLKVSKNKPKDLKTEGRCPVCGGTGGIDKRLIAWDEKVNRKPGQRKLNI